MLRILNKLRRRILRVIYTSWVKNRCLSHGTNIICNGKSHVTKETILGDNVHMNGLIVSGYGQLIIGNNFHSGPECRILTDNHNYEGTMIPYDTSIIKKRVKIEDNVWIGTCVIILPGVILGEGCIIQAGSVVVKDIPKYAIAGGHPAKVFAQRNIAHYEKLKDLKAFH